MQAELVCKGSNYYLWYSTSSGTLKQVNSKFNSVCLMSNALKYLGRLL